MLTCSPDVRTDIISTQADRRNRHRDAGQVGVTVETMRGTSTILFLLRDVPGRSPSRYRPRYHRHSTPPTESVPRAVATGHFLTESQNCRPGPRGNLTPSVGYCARFRLSLVFLHARDFHRNTARF